MTAAPPLPSNVSLLAQSPGAGSDVEVVVTIPTFRRPEQLLQTLASVKAQQTDQRFAVIVMENETEQQAGALAARELFETGAIQGALILARERGNCSAYNAGWQAALALYPGLRWVLVIDDDETADPLWLETICAAAERLGAHIVGGPQRPLFPSGSSADWERHPVFAPPYDRTGLVPALYSSGNLLVAREVLEAMGAPFLDTRFNFLGGGDSDFLSRAAARGFRLGWCAEAQVLEVVPARRLQADWIRTRSLRNGVISTLVEQRRRSMEGAGGLKVAARSAALLAASPLRGALRLAATSSPSQGLYPVYVGLGRVLAHFGYQNEQYREPEKN